MIDKTIKQAIRNVKHLRQSMTWQEMYGYAMHQPGKGVLDFEKDPTQQTVLVFAPHPDDEVFGCGGAIALHRQHNDAVHVVYLTDGSRGNKSGKADKSLVAVREDEARRGLEQLGGAESYFWRFGDGQFEASQTAVGLVKGMLEKLQPTIIYLPFCTDDHPDHQAVVPLLYEALRETKLTQGLEIRQYEIWSTLIPNCIVNIGTVLEEKQRAIKAHKSQAESRMYYEGILGLNYYRGAMSNLQDPAEAFFVLSLELFIDFCKRFLK